MNCGLTVPLMPTMALTTRPRRTTRRTLNRLVAEAEKARRPSSVVSLGHVIDEWLTVAQHEDSTRETYVGDKERLRPMVVGGAGVADRGDSLIGAIVVVRVATGHPSQVTTGTDLSGHAAHSRVSHCRRHRCPPPRRPRWEGAR